VLVSIQRPPSSHFKVSMQQVPQKLLMCLVSYHQLASNQPAQWWLGHNLAAVQQQQQQGWQQLQPSKINPRAVPAVVERIQLLQCMLKHTALA
jgi:hypothetical protein